MQINLTRKFLLFFSISLQSAAKILQTFEDLMQHSSPSSLIRFTIEMYVYTDSCDRSSIPEAFYRDSVVIAEATICYSDE